MYIVSGTIFKHFKIEVPEGNCRFVHIYQRNPVCVNKTPLCLELPLKIESQFQKATFSRDFDLTYALLLPPGMRELKIVAT